MDIEFVATVQTRSFPSPVVASKITGVCCRIPAIELRKDSRCLRRFSGCSCSRSIFPRARFSRLLSSSILGNSVCASEDLGGSSLFMNATAPSFLGERLQSASSQFGFRMRRIVYDHVDKQFIFLFLRQMPDPRRYFFFR